LVATPSALCKQWRSELSEKLRLDQFGEPFECCSHAEIARVRRRPDVLVVDEAHHLVGIDNGPLAASEACLRQLARDVPVLLLLSATPPLGEEARFLALLNLLDPLTHPLDDLDGFRNSNSAARSVACSSASILTPRGSCCASAAPSLSVASLTTWSSRIWRRR
jgi:ATP-dependent helicase HepA